MTHPVSQSRRPRRSPAGLVAAAVVAILLVGGFWVVRNVGGIGGLGDSGGSNPEDCAVVTVAASSEKAGLLGEIAQDYNDAGRDVGDGCAYVEVFSKASGGAATALAEGWDTDLDGPLPVVWSPAASSWVKILEQRRAAADLPTLVPDGPWPSVAQTPLVVAMPRPMAEALGWPDAQIGWSDLTALAKDPQGWASKGHPEWGQFRLGKTNPNFSTSGLNATIGTYFAATGLSSDLSSEDVADPAVRAQVGALEQSVVHYGDTTLTFLANLADADAEGRGLSYVSAVTVEEKSVWDYNQGNPTGDPAGFETATPPRTPLVAVYPDEGTLLSDNPFVVLTADWVDEAQRAGAQDFLAFLQQDAAQQRFSDAAFRTYEGVPGEEITPANGLLPDQPSSVLSPPSPAVLAQIQDSWQDVRKRAQVLFVFDISGSMGEPVPDSGATKIELAQDAVVAGVAEFAADDQVGLWVFSSDAGAGGQPWREVAPVAEASASVPTITDVVPNLLPDGGTALYATLRQAHEQMQEKLDPSRITAIVLLSDGRNEYPPDTDLDGLLRQLSTEDTSRSVRVFPIAYGADADVEALGAIAEASRGALYDASDPRSIDKVLVSVISNF